MNLKSCVIRDGGKFPSSLNFARVSDGRKDEGEQEEKEDEKGIVIRENLIRSLTKCEGQYWSLMMQVINSINPSSSFFSNPFYSSSPPSLSPPNPLAPLSPSPPPFPFPP